MKFRMQQMRVVPGDLAGNFQRMQSAVERAKDEGVSGLIFPELCVSGYLLGDRWNDEYFCRELDDYNHDLRALSQDLLIVYGNVAIDPRRKNRDGRMRKYNACFAWYQGAPLHRSAQGVRVSAPAGLPEGCTAKTLHPDYRFFDDSRYFFSLRDLADEEALSVLDYHLPFSCLFPGGELHLGLEICEDLWFGDYAFHHRTLNVTSHLKSAGADVLINVSASPWTPQKNQARHKRVRAALAEGGGSGVFLYVNCVGTQNNGKNILTFDGASTAYNSMGDVVGMLDAPYVEAAMDLEIQGGFGEVVLANETKKSVDSEIWTNGLLAGETFESLAARLPECPEKGHFLAACEGLRSFDAMMGGKAPWVIGLSGGIDSAMVALLCAGVFDPTRIIAVNMPGEFNSDKTRRLARELAEKIGSQWHEIPIRQALEGNLGVLKEFNPSGFNRENIQAKVRGTSILSNLAGICGGVMTNNGNKVEIALGYATLYGDVNGALAPIGDLLKVELFSLARFMNKQVYAREFIDPVLLPDERFVFDLPPTAELRPHQVDPMKWGYHDALVRAMTEYQRMSPEQVLESYAQGVLWDRIGISKDLAAQYGLLEAGVFIQDFEHFMGLFFRGVFKRIQAPPILVMSRSAFGYDFRESQLNWQPGRTYARLRSRILEKQGVKSAN